MRTAAIALTATTALALSACGGDGGPGPTAGSGDDSVSNSSTPTPGGDKGSTPGGSSTSSPRSTSSGSDEPTLSNSTKSSSAAASSSTSTDTGKPFDAQEFADRLEAAVDANPTVKIDVRFGPDATASGYQDLADDALEMDVDAGGQQMTYRLVDGQYYLAQPPKWFEVTEDSTNPLVKRALEQTALLSMRTQLDAFIAGVESAGDKGDEQVDGVRTRHYTATVRTADVRKELGLEADPDAPPTMTYDVWLDEDDLIRKMSFTQGGADAVLTASEWGEPVSITKPKSSELAEVP